MRSCSTSASFINIQPENPLPLGDGMNGVKLPLPVPFVMFLQ